MISTIFGQRILREFTKNRVPNGFVRVKSTTAEIVDQREQNNFNSDLPTIDENPYIKEKRICILCKFNIEPDYKNVRFLSQFQSQYTGRIYGRHITGLCKYKQDRMEQEIKKAQTAGLMGYMTKDPKYVRDPKLFDPNFPFRPHKY